MGRPIGHFEVMGKDGEKLRSVYAELFAWTIDADNPLGYGLVQRETNFEGVGIPGGLGGLPDGLPGHLTFYVEVPMSMRRPQPEKLGGRRTMGPSQVEPGIGLGQFSDPEGHMVGLVKGPAPTRPSSHLTSSEEQSMSKLRSNITMSLDGFVAGPNQSNEDPLGVGGMQLHQWLLSLRAFRERHGEDGGELNASTPIAEEILGNVGATIMGRNMFGGGPGPWGDEAWKGYWGDNPPYHHPVFVLTRHARHSLEMQGGTTFHFVTDGIESALEQARAAAGDQDISIGGGANVVQQYLAGGLVDEIVVSVVPILLGSGARLFDNLGEPEPRLRQVEAVEAPGVTHIRYARAR